jgi:hypothetical protein
MIPIKNFKAKKMFLAKEATLIKNFKMPFITILNSKKTKKKVK